MNDDMNPFVRLDVALEILATKIGMTYHENGSEEEMYALMKERDLLYLGDEKIIEKIYNVYAPEIKAKFTKEENFNEGYTKKKV